MGKDNNARLARARNARRDEFYTLYDDVEWELSHYTKHFKDKVVYCNCDDPEWSAFWRYFHLKFSELGLRRLISTHYALEGVPYRMEYAGGDDENIGAGVRIPMECIGDFRNQECLDILDACDIVVTNPPFSMFREFVRTLMEHKKKFIVWGNNNAVKYNEIFPYIMRDEMRIGYIANKKCVFRVGDGYYCDERLTERMNDGHRYGVVNAVSVFTNLDIAKHHEKVQLVKRYDPSEYPKYDHYDAINVNRMCDIPCDYDGIMGVPISFLGCYNPEQFEIVGEFNHGSFLDFDLARPVVNGKELYARIAVRLRQV